MGESRTSVRRLEALERAHQALELRRAGATYPMIAERLGYAGPPSAHKAVESAIRRSLREPAEEVLALELERLDRLLLAVWPQATAGDLFAIDRALKIMHRRAAYLGLDKVRIEHSGPGDQPIRVVISQEAVLERLERELQALAEPSISSL